MLVGQFGVFVVAYVALATSEQGPMLALHSLEQDGFGWPTVYTAPSSMCRAITQPLLKHVGRARAILSVSIDPDVATKKKRRRR